MNITTEFEKHVILNITGSKSKCKNCDQNKVNSSNGALDKSVNENKSLPSYYFPTSSSAASSVSTTSNCSRYIYSLNFGETKFLVTNILEIGNITVYLTNRNTFQ